MEKPRQCLLDGPLALFLRWRYPAMSRREELCGQHCSHRGMTSEVLQHSNVPHGQPLPLAARAIPGGDGNTVAIAAWNSSDGEAEGLLPWHIVASTELTVSPPVAALLAAVADDAKQAADVNEIHRPVPPPFLPRGTCPSPNLADRPLWRASSSVVIDILGRGLKKMDSPCPLRQVSP